MADVRADDVVAVEELRAGRLTLVDRDGAVRATLGPDLFRISYGTVQSNRRDAMGRCVSLWAHASHQARVSARAACSAEQADPNFAANHNGNSSLYQKMQQYLQKPASTYGNLGPQDAGADPNERSCASKGQSLDDENDKDVPPDHSQATECPDLPLSLNHRNRDRVVDEKKPDEERHQTHEEEPHAERAEKRLDLFSSLLRPRDFSRATEGFLESFFDSLNLSPFLNRQIYRVELPFFTERDLSHRQIH